MFTTTEEAITWLHSLEMHGIKPGLKRMEWMLERLGHPDRGIKFVHIGGTNGKGSTLTFMRHVLQEAGFHVGSFTSPYMTRFQNRIQYNGVDISDADLIALTNKVKPLVEELEHDELGAPTEFEVITVIAILYFGTVSYPDIVLWEVGLGGRLDSTNVVVPILSVITNVGHDHIHILGDTITQIATEKAGIIKSGVPVITGVQQPEAREVVTQTAQDKQASLYTMPHHFHTYDYKREPHGQSFSYQSVFSSYLDVFTSLQGEHQFHNAGVALMALEVLRQYYAVLWDEDELRRGYERAAWEGRFEVMQEAPLLIIDGAHNIEGIHELAHTLQHRFAHRRIRLLFTALKGKDIKQLLKPLDAIVDTIEVTTFEFPRAVELNDLMDQLTPHDEWQSHLRGAENWQSTLDRMITDSAEDDVLLVTGSLYFISQVREYLKNT
ncbi:bifunctional folylpolyglutamate synthase/dihydrofolate synthase [Caldalkalibacillus salinus]|uniref:bifunctional folylpolyglutamate synthase/dihydrofolate synthase n=1 Tax=Caldalkalibacillus salinus TaxID=2803787 RepID=UPI0019222770|nr:folylpolyglutamate synthase/dihydrofolate synthase family protein [Caldalkalibacillus salinus]